MRRTYNNKTKKRRRSKNYKTQRKVCAFRDIALFPYLFTRDLVLRSQKQRKILKMFTCFRTDKFNISKYLAAIANISTYNLSANYSELDTVKRLCTETASNIFYQGQAFLEFHLFTNFAFDLNKFSNHIGLVFNGFQILRFKVILSPSKEIVLSSSS